MKGKRKILKQKEKKKKKKKGPEGLKQKREKAEN